MRWKMFLMTLPLLVASCATVENSGTAICDGTRALVTDHARALADAPDGPWIVTGARLVAAIDAGCAAP